MYNKDVLDGPTIHFQDGVNFTMLLRMAYDFKVMNCGFLELSI